MILAFHRRIYNQNTNKSILFIIIELNKKNNVSEYLNYEEGKFSKSRGVGVFGTDAQVCTYTWIYKDKM